VGLPYSHTTHTAQHKAQGTRHKALHSTATYSLFFSCTALLSSSSWLAVVWNAADSTQTALVHHPRAGGSGGGATLAYPNGGLATVSMPRGEFDEVFEIRGTDGCVTIETPGHCPTKVTVNGVTTEYPLAPYPYMGGYPQCNQHGFYYEVEAVHRCIAKGLRETPQHSRADSLQLIWIISQVQAQAGGSVHS
jgi:predicted dehydrogenase